MFLGRTDEQRRFETALADTITGRPGPGPSQVLLVHGLGGIGKSELCGRFHQIATGELPTAQANDGAFLVASVNWQDERDKRPTDFPGLTGPQPLTVFTAIYAAVSEALAMNPERRLEKKIERAFEGYLKVVTQLPEVQARDARIADALTQGEGITEAAAKAIAQIGGRVSPVQVSPDDVDSVARVLKAVKRHGATDGAQGINAKLRPEESLTRELGSGLRRLSDDRPLVVILDTYEVIRGCGGWLRNLMNQTGDRVLWVVAARLEPEAEAGRFGELASFRRELPENKLTVIGISNFSHETIAELLEAEGLSEVDDAMVDTVASLTHGLPLAVNIVARLLLGGESLDAISRSVTEAGDGTQVVRELTERYLWHARRDPELQKDIPLLYGLALLYADRADAEMIRELWGADQGQVGRMLEDLAERYEFVLTGRRRLHQEVRDTFRRYLLDSVRREEERPANERAAALALQRTKALGDGRDTTACLRSEDWRSAAATFIWHSFWMKDRTGLDLLCEVFPAAVLLQRAFAHELVGLASFFSDTFSDEERSLLRGLASLLSFGSFIDGWLLKRRLAFHRGQILGSAQEEATDLDRRLALRELDKHRETSALLPSDQPRRGLTFLLTAKSSIRTEPEQALEALEKASELVDEEGVVAPQVADSARELSQSLLIASSSATISDSLLRIGTKAALLVAEYDDSAATWLDLAAALRAAGQPQEAVEIYEKVIDRFENSDDRETRRAVADAYLERGGAFKEVGLATEEIESYDRAVERFEADDDKELRRSVARALLRKGLTLGDANRSEEELEAYRDLVRRFKETEDQLLRKMVCDALLAAGITLESLARKKEAVATYEELVELADGSADPRLQLMVARGLVKKAILLTPSETDGPTILEEVVQRFGESDDLELKRTVCNALFTLAANYNALGSRDREIGAIERLLDYANGSDDPDILQSVISGLFSKGVLTEDPEQAIAQFDRAIEIGSDLKDPTTRFLVAECLRAKASLRRNAGNDEEALSIYDQILDRYLDDEHEKTRELIANVMWSKAATLDKLNRQDEEIEVYRHFLDHFDNDPDAEVRSIATKIQFNLGLILSQRNDEEALPLLESLWRSPPGGDPDAKPLALDAQRALLDLLLSLGQTEKAIGLLEELVSRHGEDDDLKARLTAGGALMQKISLLEALEQVEQAAEVADQVFARYGQEEEFEFRHMSASALYSQIDRLRSLERPEGALSACERLIARFDQDEDETIAGIVERAYFERAKTLYLLRRPAEELEALELLIQRLGEDREPEIELLSLKAKLGRADALIRLQRKEEALPAYTLLFEHYRDSEHVDLRRLAAHAGTRRVVLLRDLEGIERYLEEVSALIEQLSNDSDISPQVTIELLSEKALALGADGRRSEAIAAHQEVIDRAAGTDIEKVRHLAAQALYNQALLLAEDGDPQQALNKLGEVASRIGDPEDSGLRKLLFHALIKQAALLSGLGRYEEELEAYERFLDHAAGREDLLNPHALPEVRLRLHMALAQSDRPAAAQKSVDGLRSLAQELAEDPRLEVQRVAAEALRAAAGQLRKREEHASALELYLELIDRFEGAERPLNLLVEEARFSSALMLAQLQRHEEEVAAYKKVAERVTEKDPVELQRLAAYALYNAAARKTATGDHDEELSLYRSVVDRYAGAADEELIRTARRARLGEGIALKRRGDLDAAEGILRSLVEELREEDGDASAKILTEAYNSYALLLTDYREEHHKAHAVFEEALAAGSGDANNVGNFARLLFEQGDFGEALPAAEKARELAKEEGTDPVRLEVAFYLLALGPEEGREAAEEELWELLRAGTRSPDWNLRRILDRAALEGHDSLAYLEGLAAAIADEAPLADLEEEKQRQRASAPE